MINYCSHYLTCFASSSTGATSFFHSGSLFTLFTCFYNIRSKRVNEAFICHFTVQAEDQFLCIFHSGSLFTCFYMAMGCIIIQEVKGLTKKFWFTIQEEDQFLRKNFRFIVHIVYLFLHGCGLHYNVLSGLSVKQELTTTCS